MNVTHRVAPLPRTIIYMYDYRLFEFLNSLIKLIKHFDNNTWLKKLQSALRCPWDKSETVRNK